LASSERNVLNFNIWTRTIEWFRTNKLRDPYVIPRVKIIFLLNFVFLSTLSDTGLMILVARFASESTFPVQSSDEYFTIFRQMKISVSQLLILFVPRESPLRRARTNGLVKTKKIGLFPSFHIWRLHGDGREREKERERKRKKDRMKIISLLTTLRLNSILTSFPRFVLHQIFARKISPVSTLFLTIRRDRIYAVTECMFPWQSHFAYSRLVSLRILSFVLQRWFLLVVFGQSSRRTEKKGRESECICALINGNVGRAFVL